MTFWNNLTSNTTGQFAVLEHIGWILVKIILLWILARISVSVISRLLERFLKTRRNISPNRLETFQALLKNTVKYSVYFILLLTILPMFGVRIGALLAGAGVVGIAIAFGAQNLLRDFFNGAFIILENQFDTGDHVVINGTWGQVRSFTLRLTALQVWTGQVEYIPNGQIRQVTNYSKENSIAVIDINVGYNTAAEQAINVMKEAVNQLQTSHESIVGDVAVIGVQALNDSNYTLRATAECKPYEQFGVERVARQKIRAAFAENNIDLPIEKIAYRKDEPQSEEPNIE